MAQAQEVKDVAVEAQAQEVKAAKKEETTEKAEKQTLFEKHPMAKVATVVGGVAVMGITGAYFIHKLVKGQADLSDMVKANKYAIGMIKDQLDDLPNKFVEKAPAVIETATGAATEIAEPVFDSAVDAVTQQ